MEVREAQEIHDKLLRRLAKKLDQTPCAACGAVEITAAEANVIRQMLRDNDFLGIGTGAPIERMPDLQAVPFPVQRAAHE